MHNRNKENDMRIAWHCMALHGTVLHCMSETTFKRGMCAQKMAEACPNMQQGSFSMASIKRRGRNKYVSIELGLLTENEVVHCENGIMWTQPLVPMHHCVLTLP